MRESGRITRDQASVQQNDARAWCWQAAGSSHCSIKAALWEGLRASDAWVWCPVKVSQQGLPCYSTLFHCCESATKIKEIYCHSDGSTVIDGQAMPQWWGWPMESAAPSSRGWVVEFALAFLGTFPGSTAYLRHLEVPWFQKMTKNAKY